MGYVPGSSYLRSHFSLRHRLAARVSGLLDERVYTVRHGLAKGLKRKGGLGFLPPWLIGSADRTAEVRFLLRQDFAGKVVFDIGGMQGTLTMFFATRARSVVVYEPNSSNRRRLEENVRLNELTNVVVRPVGVGATEGEVELVFDPRMTGGASGDDSIARQIRQTSRECRTERVDIVRLDDDIARCGLPTPQFVKIDVEGMELDVLRGMRELLRRDQPTIYLEMHGATLQAKRANATRIVQELAASGYEHLLHIETGAVITPSAPELPAEGHLLCGRGDTAPMSPGQSRAT
jgi:FkbM family methyltransferase